MNYDDIYPEKISYYIFFYSDEMEKLYKDMENIIQIEEIKVCMEEMENNNLNYQPITVQNSLLKIYLEKIYYQERNSYVVLYNCFYEIDDYKYFDKIVHDSIKQVPIQFDIILFKECKDDNRIENWFQNENPIFPTISIIRKDSLYKILNGNFDNLKIYYSDLSINKSFINKFQDYIQNSYISILDWLQEE